MVLEQDTAAHAQEEGENYFVSMTDMMVGMLFIFIILLMSFALVFRQQTDVQERTTEEKRIDAEKIGRTLDDLQAQISRRLEDIHKASQLRRQLLEELKSQLSREGLIVEISPSGDVLRLAEEAVRFPVNGVILAGRAKENVGKIARVLARVLPAFATCQKVQTGPICRAESQASVETVFTEGHTDETGGDEQNWTLSAQRAASTYRELTAVAPELRRIFNRRGEEILSIAGYSSTRRIETGGNAAAWEKNRRIDLRFVMDTDPTAGLGEIGLLLQRMREAIRDLRGSAQ